ncbi:MAG: hypothetical protein ABW163_09960 [Luteimonas sp.]
MEFDCRIDRSVYAPAPVERVSYTAFEAAAIRSELEPQLRTLTSGVVAAVDALQRRETALEQSIATGGHLSADMSPDAFRALARSLPAYDTLGDARAALDTFMLEAYPQLEAVSRSGTAHVVDTFELSLLHGNACHALARAQLGGGDFPPGGFGAADVLGVAEQVFTATDAGMTLLDVPGLDVVRFAGASLGIAGDALSVGDDIGRIGREGLTPSAGFSLASNGGGIVAGLASLSGASVPGVGTAAFAAGVVASVLETREQQAMLQAVTRETLIAAGMPDALATTLADSRPDGILALREAGLTTEHIQTLARDAPRALRLPAEYVAALVAVQPQRGDALASMLVAADWQAFPAATAAIRLLGDGTRAESAAGFADLLERADPMTFRHDGASLIAYLRTLD